MDFITKLVLERNRDRELLNSEDAERIAKFVANKQGYELKDVITGEIYEKKPKLNGLYSFDQNVIGYFDNKRIDYIYEAATKFRELYNPDGAFVDSANFFFLICIVHEIAHLRQNHICKSPRSSIEKRLFKPFINFKEGDKLYDENHDDIPLEVNAENVGYITAYNIFSRLPKSKFITEHDQKSYQLATIKWLLFGNYDIEPKTEEVYCPYERIADHFNQDILNKMNMSIDDYAKLIYNNDNLTLYKKIMLGLPLTYKEYAYVNLLIDELTNDIDINAIKKLQKKLI